VARDDQALVDACLAGDQRACSALVAGYARMVGTVIWRATGRREIVEDLYTIAHNVAIDYLRKTGGERTEPLIWQADDQDNEEERQLPSTGLDPEAQLSQEQSERLVRDGLARLPVKYRVPVVYAAIDGLDYPTIARMLNVPLGTVKTLIFRGKRMLREEIARRLREPHGS
jgi:RNA polymerase sigma-70 factor (ECF subfamily)